MKSKEFEVILRKEVEDAKAHYLRAKRALEAYLSGQDQEYGDSTSISASVRRAALQYDNDQTFTAADIFSQINKDDMDYDQTRPSISNTLSQMVKEGKLKKVSWKEFGVVKKNVSMRRSIPGQGKRYKK